MLIQIQSANGVAAQTDLLASSIHRLSSYDRVITGAWLEKTGSSATGAIDLYVGDVNVASLAGSTTAATGYGLFPVDAELPAGAELRAITTTGAVSAGALIITIQLDDIVEDDGIDSLMGGMF